VIGVAHRLRELGTGTPTCMVNLVQKALLDQVLYPELKHAPFAKDHGDLAPLNIIVNSEYDVTG
jgi:hypothetical protein